MVVLNGMISFVSSMGNAALELRRSVHRVQKVDILYLFRGLIGSLIMVHLRN